MTNKKIFSISMVKNEMDIIESFVRYNVNILDGMVILDNGSTDDTLKILNQLKNENLPIFVFEDEDREFDKATKLNKLLKKTIEKFNADIVVPLDADEFIISSNQENPRKFLEKIVSNSYHLILWKTYVPDFKQKENEKFIPAKITFSRDDNLEKFYKVIIPQDIVKKYDVKVSRGCHSLTYDPRYKDLIKNIYNTDLRIAHFPIRSTEQVISKVSVGWINALSSIERKKNDSYHWKKIFNQIKRNVKIKKEDVIKFASEFALENNKTEIKIKEDPIELNFCENIEIKYTDKKINPMNNLLEACEWLSLSYLNLKKEKIAEKKQLKRKIEEYQNSTSWMVTSPMRKISRKIKILFKSEKFKSK